VVPILHIHLLGDFLLLSGDTPVTTITVPRLRSLFAYLVLHRAAPQSRTRLAFLLWPDSTEAQAHTNLRKLLFQLRQALPDAERFLVSDKQSLQWLPTGVSWTLDVLTVEQAFAQAEEAQQSQDTIKQALEQVVQLYRGDLLPDCYDEWILPERDRVRQLFFSAAERLIVLLERERDYATAILVARQVLRYDALHEETYRYLMRLYALRGERAAALRVYHTCVTLLERELATGPSDATRQAYEALLKTDTPSLSIEGAPASSSSPQSLSRGVGAPLIGREREWEQLQGAWRRVQAGVAHMVVLSGEAGIGKTKLAEDLLAWVERQGMTTASTQCYAAEGSLAYAPVAAWLRAGSIEAGFANLDAVWLTEIARLVPELLTKRRDLSYPTPMTEGWQRQQFFMALARAILNIPNEMNASSKMHGQPLLFLLDDLQWCDSETLAWLHYLLRFRPCPRLLLLGTVRSEEVMVEHPLQAFLATLQRDGLLTEIALARLSPEETLSLAEHVAAEPLDPTLAADLYRETEGNPLFIVEMMRAGSFGRDERPHRSQSLLTSSAAGLPPTLQAVLSTRLAQLSPLARGIANVAAVIGRGFTFAVLVQASDEGEDAVVHGLDELWQKRIVREQGADAAGTYDFSHGKLRAQAYAALSSAHRRLLHRRVARAYEAIYAYDLDAVSGQIAVHYERAGLLDRSIVYYQQAGESALRIYALVEATSAFQHAISLFEVASVEKRAPEIAAQIYQSLGDIFGATWRHNEARQQYEHARALLPPHEYILQACLLRKIARTWQFLSDNPEDTFQANARQAFQAAECILEQAEDKSNSAWLQEWIQFQIDQLLPLRASVDEMTTVIEKARATVELHGTAMQRAQFSLAVVVCDLARHRYIPSSEIIAYCRTALAAIQPGGATLGFAHMELGLCLLWSGLYDEAEEHLQCALQIADQVGTATLLVHCLTFLPFIFRARAQVGKVRDSVKRALAVAGGRKNSILIGHCAWVAWRTGSLAEAEAYARASLIDRSSLPRPNAFHWVGLWPLIGVMLTQGKIAEAMNYVRMMLDVTQQPQPEILHGQLEAVLHSWDAGQQEEAATLLQQALPLAEQIGYL